MYGKMTIVLTALGISLVQASTDLPRIVDLYSGKRLQPLSVQFNSEKQVTLRCPMEVSGEITITASVVTEVIVDTPENYNFVPPCKLKAKKISVTASEFTNDPQNYILEAEAISIINSTFTGGTQNFNLLGGDISMNLNNFVGTIQNINIKGEKIEQIHNVHRARTINYMLQGDNMRLDHNTFDGTTDNSVINYNLKGGLISLKGNTYSSATQNHAMTGHIEGYYVGALPEVSTSNDKVIEWNGNKYHGNTILFNVYPLPSKEVYTPPLPSDKPSTNPESVPVARTIGYNFAVDK